MKRALIVVGIVILVIVVVISALPFFINVNNFRPRIEAELTNALGRKVTVGNLSLSIWSGSVGADNIAIADDPSFSDQPFIRAQSLKVGVELLPLIFSRALHITNLTLTQPQVNLLRDRSGKWNFSTLGSAAPAKSTGTPPPSSAGQPPAPAESKAGQGKTPATKTKKGKTPPAKSTETEPAPQEAQKPSSPPSIEQKLSVGKLSIRNGQISVADTATRNKPHVYRNVDLTVTNFSYDSKFPFTLTAGLPGGGTAKLDGNGGPINASDASMTPLQAKINVNGFDLGASGFVDPSSGIAGVANFTGTMDSNGTQAHSSGDATVNRLKLSPKGSPAKGSVAMKYRTTYDMPKQTGDVSADVTIGKALAKLTGTYDLHGEEAAVNVKLHADNMPVDDLETMLPALGVTLPAGSSLQGGTLTADMSASGPVNKLDITGPVKLVNTKLHGFDMGSKMSAISALAGLKSGPDTEIKNFSTDVHMTPAGIQTNNVDLVVPAIGTVTGNGTVSPQDALNYKMTAALSGTTVSGLSQLAGLSGKGANVPFFIQGTASNPKFVPDVKGMLGSGLGSGLGKNLGSQLPAGQNAQGVMNKLGGLLGKKKPK
jgi:AsmA protein